MNKKRYLLLGVLVTLLLGLSACNYTPSSTEKNSSSANSTTESHQSSETATEEVSETDSEVIIVDANETVSVFSWFFELSNPSAFEQLVKPLEELGVNRIYQLFSAEYLKGPQMPVLVHNLSQKGIETVLLTGDKSWITDGLTEFKHLIDALVSYNASVSEELQIHTVALDVEVHAISGWKENSKKLFRSYVDLMKDAKAYANEHNLRVVQIVPTFFDTVDEELFMDFLLNCCDELSIMNYNKKASFTAIATEVALCQEYDIPVETLFETMPVNKQYGVTAPNTYYYDGIEVLQSDIIKIKETYGPTLGIGYHHFSTLYPMCTQSSLAEIYPTKAQEKQPGNLILTGSDGRMIIATPYWPTANTGSGKYCWLAIGAKEGVEYTVHYYDMFHDYVLEDKLIFEEDESEIRLKAEIALP